MSYLAIGKKGGVAVGDKARDMKIEQRSWLESLCRVTFNL